MNQHEGFEEQLLDAFYKEFKCVGPAYNYFDAFKAGATWQASRAAIAKEGHEEQSRLEKIIEAAQGVRGLDKIIAARLEREGGWCDADRRHHANDIKLRDEARSILDALIDDASPTPPEQEVAQEPLLELVRTYGTAMFDFGCSGKGCAEAEEAWRAVSAVIASPPAKVEPSMEEVERLVEEFEVPLRTFPRDEHEIKLARTALLTAIASLGGDGKDGERYRWLRKNGHCHEKQQGGALLNSVNPLKRRLAYRYWCTPEESDAAVDQAIAAERSGK